jgi:hypothetical protein
MMLGAAIAFALMAVFELIAWLWEKFSPRAW